ncbi:kinase [Mycobacterium sp. CBMA271]|uniref:kinase n=1 Tax=unclassified Mycobacteroides TaxID=2618759 RepID=UPI0012DEB083|nr:MULTISPECIES: kinase [unclassified Mycobacteroides]MUM18463.1 kinase [Mycobacteroides sp. CBMA 326]MUM23732.1 kinase [Mycobacteroides sp. CBMA 271]
MTTLLADPVAQVMATAEELLTRRAGATVTLAEPEDLGGSGPAIVLRVRAVQNPFALPKSMVIKQVPEGGSDASVLREVVSYQFANSLTAKHRPGPELVAYDIAERLIVLTDLGSAPTMSELLAERNRAATNHALMAWAQALGRMHVATVGREVDFAALLRRIGVKKTDVDSSQQRLGGAEAIAPLRQILRTEYSLDVSEALVSRIQQTAELFGKGGVRAFSPSEVAPDNILVTEHGVRILDYEWGGFRDIVLDIAHALTVYPEFLSAAERDAVAELDDAMTEAWRSDVVSIAPALADDESLARRILDARLMWVWLATHEYLTIDVDLDGDAAVFGNPAPTHGALLGRWMGLRAAAERVGDQDVVVHAAEVIAALRGEAVAAE